MIAVTIDTSGQDSYKFSENSGGNLMYKTELTRKLFCLRNNCTIILLAFLIILMWSDSKGQDSPSISQAEVREIIAEGNRIWGKARVEFDKEMFEKMLAPDFYVKIRDQRLTRQEFIDRISIQSPAAKLTRFDATVLTVQPIGDEWVAVIHEKLELKTADGTLYSLWITKDGWKKVGNEWLITFSEAIGFEQWGDGKKPPFPEW